MLLPTHRSLNDIDVELYAEWMQAEARQRFIAYRKYIRPQMKIGWWLIEVSRQLEQFYQRLVNRERPKLLLMAPPQHGKTTLIEDFIAWLAGIDPSLKMIFTSYSDDLGLRVNINTQRILDDFRYHQVFGQRIPSRGDVSKGLRNLSLLEFTSGGGSFRNTTVLGQITGKGLDVGFLDDPVKGRQEANSLTVRDRTWNWVADDFFTRFSEYAGFILTLTRWHLDDPAGRFLERFPDCIVLKYPALAEHDELHRYLGDPLFPELKSREFLLERRQMLTKSSWESLYQQNPIIIGGSLFPIEKFQIVDALPANIKKTVRYWDKAGTTDDGAYTAGVKMHSLQDGRFIVSDVRRAQLSALEREQLILQTAHMDATPIGNPPVPIYTSIWLEQEPGSGGKESAERSVRMLAGFKAQPDKVSGKKEIRAEPYAAQVQAGNVMLLKAPWNRSFIDEHEFFPNGTYKDQVDAASGAFMKLTLGSTYDGSQRWVGDASQQYAGAPGFA